MDVNSDASSMDTNSDTSESEASTDSYDKMMDVWLAHACEWCSTSQYFGVCNGQGRVCNQMAQYIDAQTCSRLNYVSRDAIRLPPMRASLQSRIVILAESAAKQN